LPQKAEGFPSKEKFNDATIIANLPRAPARSTKRPPRGGLFNVIAESYYAAEGSRIFEPRYPLSKFSTDERANKHQVDYERELFINDREKWHAHMRDKLFKHGERKEAPKQSRAEVKATEVRAAEMREFSERLKADGRDKAESKSAPNKDAPASNDGEK
jgi:hypothetical protein